MANKLFVLSKQTICDLNRLEEDVCFFCPQIPPDDLKVEGLGERVRVFHGRANGESRLLFFYANPSLPFGGQNGRKQPEA